MRGARLHRQRVLPMRADVELDAPICTPHRGVEFRRLQPPFDDDVSGGFGVDERCAVRERGSRADHRRHLFDVDLDTIGNVLGLFLRRRDHRSDRLADEPHDIARQHRLADRHVAELVQQRLDRLHACELGGGDDGRALRRHDPLDPTRRDRAPDETNPARRRQVARELAVAGHQCRILETPDRTADPTAMVLGIDGHSAPRFAQITCCRSRVRQRSLRGSSIPLLQTNRSCRAASAVIDHRSRAKTRRGFASAIASISAADNPADRSSASGSMSAGGNE